MALKICNILKDILVRNHTTVQKVQFLSTTAAAIMPSRTCCNNVNLLSTHKRDFLIRNNGQKIKIDNLNGKFVAVLYLHYPTHRNASHPLGLLEAYKTLHPKGDFEVVFVAFTENDDEEEVDSFNYYFQNMPFLAVPYSDFGTRKRVRDHLFLPINGTRSRVLLLDKLGYVLCDDGMRMFDIHGANWYPFTRQRTLALCVPQYSAELSLKEVLSSPSRDYVLTKNRDKVLIGELESKVVGLFFYYGQYFGHIRSVYEQLKAKGMDFEIVFINRYSEGGCPNEDAFNTIFEKMPWLAVPFGETVCDKLAYTLSVDFNEHEFIPGLVIVKDGEVCSLCGTQVIEQYGVEAYPFTIEKAAEIEIEKVSLLSLFDAEGQEFVTQNDDDKTKIKVSELYGKRICMLFTSNKMPSETLSHLINWYSKMKRMDDEFELVYVSTCESATEFDEIIKKMPSAWLALPFGARPGRQREICKMLDLISSTSVSDMLVFFEADGKYFIDTDLQIYENSLLSNQDYPYNVENDPVHWVCQIIRYENEWYSWLH